MDERFKLPEEISEIHLGFSSLKYFVGHTDIGKCTEVDISFKDKVWTVRAVYDGKEYIKKYKKLGICASSLMEISETEESATHSAADVN